MQSWTPTRLIYGHFTYVNRYVHFKCCQASLPTCSHAYFTLTWLLGNTSTEGSSEFTSEFWRPISSQLLRNPVPMPRRGNIIDVFAFQYTFSQPLFKKSHHFCFCLLLLFLSLVACELLCSATTTISGGTAQFTAFGKHKVLSVCIFNIEHK